MTWLPLGIVGKAHGLKGAFFVSGREEVLPSTLETVAIGEKPEQARRFKVQRVQMQGSRPLMICEGIERREDVDPFIGQTIWGQREELGLTPDERIWADLLNKEVVSSDGVVLGKVARINNYGASDVIYVEHPEKGECAIPLVDIYFDLAFALDAPRIHMRVPANTFDEAWES